MKHARLLSLLAVAATVLVSSPAPAQPRSPGFSLNRFDPAEHGSDWFAMESLDLRGHLRPIFGLVAEYAHKPLVIYDGEGNELVAPVEHQLFAHVGGGLILWDRWRVSLNMPLALYTAGDPGAVDGQVFQADEGFSAGDLRLGTDVRVVGTYDDPFSLALGVQVHLPTGSQDSFTGDGKVRIVPRANIAGTVGAFVYSARLGTNIRTNTDNFAGQPFGTELTFGAAVGARVVDGRLFLGPEIYGSTVVSDGGDGAFGGATTPLELLLGGHYTLENGLKVGLGAGPGLTRGFGSPLFRVLGSLSWTMPYEEEVPVDTDGDGILDKDDACPQVKGIRTGDPATHGCPDSDGDGIVDKLDACPQVPGRPHADPALNGCPDSDGDGIFDTQDACPNEPGVATSDPATHGCPDADGDGILDKVDACPQVAGVASSDPAKNGCPPSDDTDGDGILNAVDACPTVRGIASSDPAKNGCPDSDGDGIIDKNDACPNKAGVADPDPKKNGCPIASVVGARIEILQRVEFDTARATIRSSSEPVLNAVLKILTDHPGIKKISVEGHTDSRGGRAYNLQLSQQRAASVVNWLVKSGIDRARLTSQGFGPDKPIDSNETEEGRQENRRVEFHILDSEGVEVRNP